MSTLSVTNNRLFLFLLGLMPMETVRRTVVGSFYGFVHRNERIPDEELDTLNRVLDLGSQVDGVGSIRATVAGSQYIWGDSMGPEAKELVLLAKGEDLPTLEENIRRTVRQFPKQLRYGEEEQMVSDLVHAATHSAPQSVFP